MTVSALIFDLDDTLFDTWGQLVQPAAREACLAMIAAGLNAELEHALQTRAALFAQQPRADVYGMLVEALGVRPGQDPELVRLAGHRAYFGREVEPHIALAPETAALLSELCELYALFLVTTGVPRTQRSKVAYLRLEPYFREVHYVDGDAGQTKRDAFERILADHGFQPHHVICIGDRPDREIMAANQLGMVSVRVRGGEFNHLRAERALECAHHEIESVTELRALLRQGT